jgi:hypothetical protein
MTLSRVVIAVDGQNYALVKPRWLTLIFVSADVLSFLIQGAGAGVLSSSDSASTTDNGNNIIIGGLIFQLVAFGIFVLVTLLFNVKYRRHAVHQSVGHVPWQGILVMLYVTSILIMLRNVFRVIEYGTGRDGYLLEHEWPVYVLDGAPMLITMIAFAWKYPSQLRRGKPADGGLPLRSFGS